VKLVSVAIFTEEGAQLTARIIRNRKYMLAILWNWNHRFLGTKLSGVYFAVLILFRR
jgi:hypothetical protein